MSWGNRARERHALQRSGQVPAYVDLVRCWLLRQAARRAQEQFGRTHSQRRLVFAQLGGRVRYKPDVTSNSSSQPTCSSLGADVAKLSMSLQRHNTGSFASAGMAMQLMEAADEDLEVTGRKIKQQFGSAVELAS